METIQEAGIWGYTILCTDACQFLFVIVALVLMVMAFMKKNVKGACIGVGVVLLLMAILSLGIGTAGYFFGLEQLDAAIMNAPPESVDELRAAGESIALQSLYLGVGSCCCPGTIGFFAVVAGFFAGPKHEAE